MSAQLHYIYDPLCGWCYGAEPLMLAALGVDGLALKMHAGCLWPEPTTLPEQMRAYIQQADKRVGAMSGQPYGAAYLEGLLLDPNMVLDSRPTIAAVLAAAALDPTKGVGMLTRIQHAHYEDGRHVVRHDVLCDIATQLGLERSAFEAELERVPTAEHIAETHRLMGRLGARGFPFFALEIDGRWQPVAHQRFAGDAGGFAQWLRDEIGSHGTDERSA